jgi:hypothetical protein
MDLFLKRKLNETKEVKCISDNEMIKTVNESFPQEALIGLTHSEKIKLFKLVYSLLKSVMLKETK